MSRAGRTRQDTFIFLGLAATFVVGAIGSAVCVLISLLDDLDDVDYMPDDDRGETWVDVFAASLRGGE